MDRDRRVGGGVGIEGQAEELRQPPQREVARPDGDLGLGAGLDVDASTGSSAAVSRTVPAAVIHELFGRGDRKNDEGRVGGVALLELDEPLLPALPPVLEVVEAADAVHPDEELRRARRAAGPHLELHHLGLALGERRVDGRQVADEQGDEAEPDERLEEAQDVGGSGDRVARSRAW